MLLTPMLLSPAISDSRRKSVFDDKKINYKSFNQGEVASEAEFIGAFLVAHVSILCNVCKFCEQEIHLRVFYLLSTPAR